MPNKLKTRLITGFMIVLVIAAAAAYLYLNRTIYNPEGVRGNTAGNLNNNGMYCEYDGKIYFANPYDRNRLYVMNSDCSNISKLNDDTVCSINVYGKYIYYVRNNFSPETMTMVFRGQLLGVIRTNLDGKKPASLYDSVAGVINLYGNDLYYQHYSNDEGFSFYKVKIEKERNITVKLFLIILGIVLAVLIVAFIVLTIVGKKLQKKQEDSKAQMEAASQIASILVIDKKRMKLVDAGLPKIIVENTPNYYC